LKITTCLAIINNEIDYDFSNGVDLVKFKTIQNTYTYSALFEITKKANALKMHLLFANKDILH